MRLTIERLKDGRYKATPSHPGKFEEWIEWDPSVPPATDGNFSGPSTQPFRRALRGLDLGIACKSCSYLEFEHNIDGEERAPCPEFKTG